jgi:hypothetical protein
MFKKGRKGKEKMNDLQIIVTQQVGMIESNYEDIKANLAAVMESYKLATYTDETMNLAKKDAASLKKIKKAIDQKRIEVKKKHMIPYEEFEKKCNELKKLIDEPIELIETQVQEYEAHKKAEKKAKIEEYFQQATKGLEDYLKFDICFKLSWVNLTTTMKAVKAEIDSLVEQTRADIDSIKSFGSEIEEKALNTYRLTHQLSQAIRQINDYEKQKAEIIAREEAKRKAEEERRRREEEERIRAEERRKLEEEQRRKAEEERKIQVAIEKAKEDERARIEAEKASETAYNAFTSLEEMGKDVAQFQNKNLLEDIPEAEDDLGGIWTSMDDDEETGFAEEIPPVQQEPNSRTYVIYDLDYVLDNLEELLTENGYDWRRVDG